jgi:hypothetical protein
MSGRVEGVIGNRKVPRIALLAARLDLRGGWSQASSGEEGGSWGKHGFPHATEPQAREAA